MRDMASLLAHNSGDMLWMASEPFIPLINGWPSQRLPWLLANKFHTESREVATTTYACRSMCSVYDNKDIYFMCHDGLGHGPCWFTGRYCNGSGGSRLRDGCKVDTYAIPLLVPCNFELQTQYCMHTQLPLPNVLTLQILDIAVVVFTPQNKFYQELLYTNIRQWMPYS